ncbi:hypothetical protein CWR48_12895 [Oceanobacillus arenosus]|uniref:DUF3397 domain-containing protein n=1 Tax=Oceanobacillus arenosus TaxID=1229153 RepID=A0A3D8PTJ1_9BACI|nr:DUF3397 family protein [Oceanobacillus arenosus]RDW18459.1 hypothetical protein CWR48_12895 [Oceanobacillus arenosus]
MVDVIINIFAFLTTAPVVLTAFIYYISIKSHRPVWKAIHTAVNWTTIFYMIAVCLLVKIIFDITVTGYVSVFFLFLLGMFTYMQWRFHTDIKVTKAFKLAWRICFLLFLCLYLCLIITGIILEMI